MKKKSVFIIGAYGFKNIGDEAILRGLLKEIEGGYSKITVSSINPPETILQHGVNAETNKIKGIILSDDVIMGGGEMLQDGIVWKFFAFSVLARLMGKKVMALGVGVDVHGKIERALASLACHIISEISVRDSRSKNNLVALGVNPDKVKIIKDFAFGIKPRLTENMKEYFSGCGLQDRKFVIISLRRKTPEYDKIILGFFAGKSLNLKEYKNIKTSISGNTK